MPLGSIAAPTITPLRAPSASRPSFHIDSGTYIEIETISPHCSIYFTTNGEKPNPFARRFSGREITFKYRAPFALKPGKRMVKAVAVAHGGLQESPCVSRTFIVDDVNPGHKPPLYLYESDRNSGPTIEEVDSDTEPEFEKRRDHYPKKNDRDLAKFVADHRRAWGDENDKPSSARFDEEPPFQPTNHTGTQINVYHGPPGMFGTPFQLQAGDVTYGSMPPVTYGPMNPLVAASAMRQSAPDGISKEQLGYLANTLAQKMDQSREKTVSDVKELLHETEKARKPSAAPTEFDPPLQSESPANGDLKKQLQHVYAHALDLARRDPNFRAAVASAQLGPIQSGGLDDDDDSFTVTLQFAKAGSARPKPKPQPKPKAAPPQPKKSPSPPPEPKRNTLRTRTPSPPPPPPADDPRLSRAQERPMEKPDEEVKIGPAKIAEHDKKTQAAPELKLKTEEEKKPSETAQSTYFETEEYVQEPTLKPYPNFRVEEDVKRLHKAIEGMGTDEATIAEIMGHRALLQRMDIKKKYKLSYGKDLIDDIDAEMKPSADFKSTCRALLMQPDEFDAYSLYHAMKGLGTDEDCLIEIIFTRTNEQLKKIRETYKSMFNQDLEKDVIDDTSGDFKRLLVAFLQGDRPEGQVFDREEARKDAQKFWEAGEARWGTDEGKFRELLSTHSNAHLRATFDEYEKLAHKSLEDSIKAEMSGDFKNSMLAVVRAIRHKPAYFAHTLVKAFGSIGKSASVIRVIVSRCESDMVQVKEAFQAEAQKPLGQAIVNYSKGYFGRILCGLTAEDSFIGKK